MEILFGLALIPFALAGLFIVLGIIRVIFVPALLIIGGVLAAVFAPKILATGLAWCVGSAIVAGLAYIRHIWKNRSSSTTTNNNSETASTTAEAPQLLGPNASLAIAGKALGEPQSHSNSTDTTLDGLDDPYAVISRVLGLAQKSLSNDAFCEAARLRISMYRAPTGRQEEQEYLLLSWALEDILSPSTTEAHTTRSEQRLIARNFIRKQYFMLPAKK